MPNKYLNRAVGERRITEDDPGWDARTMGNRRWGPGAKDPSGKPLPLGRGVNARPRGEMGRGRGPVAPAARRRGLAGRTKRARTVPETPYNRAYKTTRPARSEDSDYNTVISGTTGGSRRQPLSSNVGTAGDVRQRRGQRPRG